MQFFATIALLASAVAVYAGDYPPTGEPSESAPGKIQACGNGQKLSCCQTGQSNIPILGGACELPILGQSCAGNQAFCCDATQNGLINIGSICLPLTL
ncbi:Hypothetical protein R9X50_00264900 [Acrodontium crateriforme]|uniref:Hydrophobin n=1 Tax=Acrodontium crateriforme TaxID=150365 RepID=A0AAQ3M1L6_9PEZI|nr:Hypothetical protein R9X50_00264900 [Acrodontium crateriforme]